MKKMTHNVRRAASCAECEYCIQFGVQSHFSRVTLFIQWVRYLAKVLPKFARRKEIVSFADHENQHHFSRDRHLLD